MARAFPNTILGGSLGWLLLTAAIPACAETTSTQLPHPRPWGAFGELVTSRTIEPGMHLFTVFPKQINRAVRTRNIIYALPNGNTTSQTIGRKVTPPTDWHFGIQHIGAQTRRLRELLPNTNVIVTYVEAEKRSWPSWRRRYPDNSQKIVQMVEEIRRLSPDTSPTVELSGHSGGGSLIFGYINGVETIPDYVSRIAFLDADYAYDEAMPHGRKLADWLKRSDRHCLCVICYDDRKVRLGGKPIVSATGGTFSRTEMIRDFLRKEIALEQSAQGDFVYWRGLGGRVELVFNTNPRSEILHTVLVERNGFVHSMLTGTELDTHDMLWGSMWYAKWIQND